MNLPNKLSILRVLMIPVCVFLMYMAQVWGPWSQAAAFVVFLAAAFTDFLDGHIARSQGIVTNFGKFLDPVADKLLVLSMFVMLTSQGLIPAWMVILILARELAVDGLRLIAVSQGVVIAAGQLGKLKTMSQLITIGFWQVGQFAFIGLGWYTVICWALLIWSVFITVLSGVDYFVKNARFLREGDENT